MQRYCGIDLHNNSVVSLINDQDQLIYEKRRDNNLETIEHYLQPYQDATPSWSYNKIGQTVTGIKSVDYIAAWKVDKYF